MSLEHNRIEAKKWYKKLIFQKYRIKKLINASYVSYVFDGIYEQKGTPVIIKIEIKENVKKILESEVSFQLLAKGFGIPKVLGFGFSNSYPIMIEEKLGKSIFEITLDKNLNLKDICMFAIQAIERIQFVHSKGIVHRDIKPSNFVIGREDPEIIYLIDFGYAHKYKSSRTGKHLISKSKLNNFGCLQYKSISSNKGYEESRRDDLESLGYTIIYLAKDKLPWDDLLEQNINNNLKAKLICQKKESIQAKDLCSGLPEEIGQYIDYCKQLSFEETPDYEKIKFFF